MKTRIIHTRFWQDNFVCELTAIAKLVFIYLLTNERLGLTGGYECPDKFILWETGISKEQLERVKVELSDKIIFQDGWVGLKNASKYNNYSDNSVHKKAYEKELNLLPENIKKFILVKDYSWTSQGLDKNQKQEIRNKKQEIRKEELNLTDKELTELQQQFTKKDVLQEYKKAKDWILANGKTYKDYLAFFRNWLRRSDDTGYNPMPKKSIKVDTKTLDLIKQGKDVIWNSQTK